MRTYGHPIDNLLGVTALSLRTGAATTHTTRHPFMKRSLRQLQHGIRRRLARLIAPPDTPPHNIEEPAYYPQQPTCQIPQLWFLFELFFGRRTDGTFVEIGAHDGVMVSNTWGLAERGWRGWMAEPVPALATRCRQAHAHHPNVTIVETAVSAPGTDDVRLFVADTLTTANPTLFTEYHHTSWAIPSLTDDEIIVPATTLDQFLRQQGVPHDLDLLVVDVEGHETEVFSTLDLLVWTPKMIIVELTDTHPSLTSTTHADAALGTQLLDADYRIVYKDWINTVFVRRDVWTQTYTAP